ncbi:DUF3558 family protein [Fodinicola feengrottensis]|uniref:DUF3558 domain-containing protein n=1 Tax=Fodinicola feengrottensis TaxID=435914 RepID=A0ABP4UF60_9ACTN|nr:DUF3558 family protein [Fodinicola feengrottensis]
MNIRRVALAAGAFALGVGMLTGCGLTPKTAATPSPSAPAAADSSPTASAAGFPSVCDMFTDADMSALTQGTIASHKPDGKSTPAAPACDWLSADGGITVTASLRTTTKSDFDSSADGYTPVSGVGDKATELHGILTVFHAPTTEIGIIFGGGGDPDVAIQKAIALKIIEKLDGGASPSPSASASASASE